MSEPTMKDAAVAAKWLADTFGASRVQASEVDALAHLLAQLRNDERELCAKAIEDDRDRVMATGMPSLGESCIYDVCAITVRQSAGKQEQN